MGSLLTAFYQSAVVLALSPLVHGILEKMKARVESRRGITPLQPYYDLVKWFRKENVVPEGARVRYLVLPVLAFTIYTTIPTVVPVVVAVPSAVAPTVDFLGGAFLFGLASYLSVVTVERVGTYYTGIGATRSVTFASFAEPVLITVFFAVALISSSNNPFLTNHVLRESPYWLVSPTHVLVTAGFFMLLLFETGKLPTESHGLSEFGMIEQGKGMEYSGPVLAVATWGSWVKNLTLMSVFLNVFAIPWGCPLADDPLSLLEGTVVWFGKVLALLGAFLVVEEALAKVRLFKIIDYLSVSFLLTVLGVIAYLVTGGSW